MEHREKIPTAMSIPLDRDIFLRSIIRELMGTLEDVIGYDEAAGYISLVGQNVGEWINDLYRKEAGVHSLTRAQVIDVLVDLKSRIQGDFSVVGKDEHKIILDNGTCPFGDKVIDRPSLCMMTSNVFGVIASQNLGYAKVVLERTIASGVERCRVIVYTKDCPEAERAEGREYFGVSDFGSGQKLS